MTFDMSFGYYADDLITCSTCIALRVTASSHGGDQGRAPLEGISNLNLVPGAYVMYSMKRESLQSMNCFFHTSLSHYVTCVPL